jgi:DNA repair protein RadA/Sms
MEVQALVSPGGGSFPQRNTTGVDPRRLGQIVAVLEKRLGAGFSRQDVFVNVAGGMRADEPAIDLGIALSLLSSLHDIPIPPGLVAVGEVGLGGEIRSVSQVEMRIREAARLGFERMVLPKNNARASAPPGIRLHGVDSVADAAAILTAGSVDRP